jgi:hypothetical protein
VSTTGIEKNPFRSGRLPGIDVSHDSDVSGIFQVGVHCI